MICGHLDGIGQFLRDDHATRQSGNGVTLLDNGAILRGDTLSTIDEVVSEGPAVLRIGTLIGLGTLTAVFALESILGLALLDVEEALLGSDGFVGLVIVGKQGIPPLLLFCGHFTTVSLFTESIDLGIQTSSFLLEFF